MDIVSRKPAECSADELGMFHQRILESGEVEATGLSELITAAAALALLYDGQRCRGVGALKNPRAEHRREVFVRAESKVEATAFPLELGWVHVRPTDRENGFAQALVKRLVEVAGETSSYATVRSDNAAMLHILAKFGFSPEGSGWPSRQTPKATLLLLLRGPIAPTKE